MIMHLIDIMGIKNITYCIWDDVTCSVQKRRHPHRTKQVEENFQYPQDMLLETPFLNLRYQMHVHAGQILMFQAGK